MAVSNGYVLPGGGMPDHDGPVSFTRKQLKFLEDSFPEILTKAASAEDLRYQQGARAVVQHVKQRTL